MRPCHILQCEDVGMVGQFVVVESLDDRFRPLGPIAAAPTVPAH